MSSERILQLLAKKMGQAASDKELSELQGLLQEDPKNYLLIEMLESLEVEKIHKEPVLKEVDLLNKNWLSLKRELDSIPVLNAKAEKVAIRKSVGMWKRLAAVWVGTLLLAGGYFLLKNNLVSEKQDKQLAEIVNQLSVPYGAPVEKVLPDSSIVWINAGSLIHYDESFGKKNRNLYLNGEAYFNVKHNADLPFIVHAGNIAIRAIGTKFNVHAYETETKIETTLISGEILVRINGKPVRDIILVPNEKLTIINKEFIQSSDKNTFTKDVSFQVQKVNIMPSITALREVAWLQDKLAFQNESFDELAKKMERRYDIHIIFKDSLLERERLSGVFENENIRKALHLLQMTTPFQYQFKEDSVFLKR